MLFTASFSDICDLTSSPLTCLLLLFFSYSLGLQLTSHLPHLSAVILPPLSSLDMGEGVRQEHRCSDRHRNRMESCLLPKHIKKCEELETQSFWAMTSLCDALLNSFRLYQVADRPDLTVYFQLFIIFLKYTLFHLNPRIRLPNSLLQSLASLRYSTLINKYLSLFQA